MEQEIVLPEGVSANYKDGRIQIKGSNGELEKKLLNPKIEVSVDSGKIKIASKRDTRSQKKVVGTFKAHIRNMIKGVTQGYIYKLKVCSSHFPMSTQVQENKFVLKNFYGERVPRKIKISEGVDVKVKGDVIEVSSPDKELAGQTAASIEQMTRRPNYDTRIFQDGIYIFEKAGKEV